MPPNVLLLCTDQQRFSALGAYGNDEIETPNLDRLADQGVLFENCYVQSPVCAPSRASLMTGRYVHAHGLWANGVGLRDHERLFSKDLAEAGYDCGLVGKFHLNACFGGRSEKRHDDGFRVFRWAHDPYPGSSENEYHRWLHTLRPELAGTEIDYDTLPTEVHYSRWIGDQTIDFLTRSRDRGKPFLFIANFFDPHHGFGAPDEYVRRYREKALSRPIPDDLAGKPPIQSDASESSYAGHARGYTSYTPEELQEVKAAYYAMVTLVDDEVGRILDSLDAEGLSENTLVIFTSDHGEMLGDHELMLLDDVRAGGPRPADRPVAVRRTSWDSLRRARPVDRSCADDPYSRWAAASLPGSGSVAVGHQSGQWAWLGAERVPQQRSSVHSPGPPHHAPPRPLEARRPARLPRDLPRPHRRAVRPGRRPERTTQHLERSPPPRPPHRPPGVPPRRPGRHRRLQPGTGRRLVNG
jgi:arylsulfatase A-like enzyme